MKAANIKTGMKFHDGSRITVLSETKCFVTVLLSDGHEMAGKSVERKWHKNSEIQLWT